MIHRYRSTNLLAVLALAFASASLAAETAFVRIEAARQGILKGESLTKGREDWNPIRSFGYSVVSPTDVSSGLPTGRTQFGLVSFAKDWGRTSPQLFQALATNESLKKVVFEFTRVDKLGQLEVYYRVTLSNARIANFRQALPLDGAAPLDSVGLSYQTLEVESVTGGTSAVGEPGGLAARSAGSAFGLSYSMVDGNFKVALPDEEVELRFLDLNGALVKSLVARGGEVRFDARSLGVQPGMYLLKASVAGQSLGTVPVSIAK